MFFYLYSGRGYNSFHGEQTKRCLISLFCVVIFKTTSIHTKRRVTLDAFEYYGSHHAPHWTHATTPLLGVAVRPVLIVMCVQSSDVSRSWSWSLYRHGWSWLMPRPCQHLSDKGETKISVKFSSHHLKIKRIHLLTMARSNRWKKSLRGWGESVHRQGCGCWPATLPTSSSSSELLAEKSGLGGCDIEDRREGGRGSSSMSSE